MNWYDYITLLPDTPAFSNNIKLMVDMIYADNGGSPTALSSGENYSCVVKPMNGTGPASGKGMLHFRLPARYDESELIIYLESQMSDGPKPPIKVESIRSRDKIIDVGDGVFEYEVLVEAKKAKFLPYMAPVPDGSGGTRPPNISDDLFISCYQGVEPIKLV